MFASEMIMGQFEDYQTRLMDIGFRERRKMLIEKIRILFNVDRNISCLRAGIPSLPFFTLRTSVSQKIFADPKNL